MFRCLDALDGLLHWRTQQLYTANVQDNFPRAANKALEAFQAPSSVGSHAQAILVFSANKDPAA